MSEQPIIPTTANFFKPSEIIGFLHNHLATGQVNQKVVRLRGIYFKGTYINQYYHTATDRLVDESTSDELTLSIGENGAFPPTRDGCIHSLSMRERG